MSLTGFRSPHSTAQTRRGLRGLGILAVFLLALCFGALRSSGYFIPGDPKKGMKLFFEKGCARCHSILGEGGRRAPDLARSPAGHLNLSQLVAAMWNHAPEMWEKMQLEGYSLPRFDAAEMTDLFAFLYTVRSFDEPGSPVRGRSLMIEKKCAACHAVEGQGGQVGPDLKAWARYRNPVTWTQTMWNHAPQMQQALAARGIRWPVFEGTDMADLMAYVRSQAAAGPAVYLSLPDADRGLLLFNSKGCVSCHTQSPQGGQAPPLTAQRLPQTIGQFAGSMWNHSPQMLSWMQGREISWPEFTQQEMADLIAYLFSKQYLGTRGNVRVGQQLFQSKGCARCHAATSGSPAAGPDLSAWGKDASAIQLATAMWNHGPAMLSTMREARLSWPHFEEREIGHLLEFLKSKLPRPEKE